MIYIRPSVTVCTAPVGSSSRPLRIRSDRIGRVQSNPIQVAGLLALRPANNNNFLPRPGESRPGRESRSLLDEINDDFSPEMGSLLFINFTCARALANGRTDGR